MEQPEPKPNLAALRVLIQLTRNYPGRFLPAPGSGGRAVLFVISRRKVRLDLAWRLVELPPGNSDDVPAERLEPAVARAVGLEGVRGVVNGAAVKFDDEVLCRPDAVDLGSLDQDVGLRERKTGVDEEGLEALFELAADDPEAALELVQDRAHLRFPVDADGVRPGPTATGGRSGRAARPADRIASKAKLQELGPRHQAVLALGDAPDRALALTV